MAIVNQTAGSLALQPAAGSEAQVIFPEGSTVAAVTWSPDSRTLLVVRNNWQPLQPLGTGVESLSPIEIWQVAVTANQASQPKRVYQSTSVEAEAGEPEQILFGAWAPDGRRVIFWLGILSASILADGLTPWLLDVETGQTSQLVDTALISPSYQSWSPHSSALVITAGGGRETWQNKWLALYDVAGQETTIVVSQTEQIPGIVAWSPQGDRIAYVAGPAEMADANDVGMTFDNPGIAGRRIWLLDPATGQHERLNESEAYQDAPTWNEDGTILYYVQREADFIALLATDLTSGQSQVIVRRRAQQAVGYYGLETWTDLLAYRPEAPLVEVPPLAETYTDPGGRYSFRYPADWTIGKGWHRMPTLSPAPSGEAPDDLGPFSGHLWLAVEVKAGVNSLDAALEKVLPQAGLNQVLGSGRQLILFDQRQMMVNGLPALRLETLDDFGVVNHLLIVQAADQAFILRGQGDGRVFEAIANSLEFMTGSN